MKKSIIVKLLMISLAMIFVFAFASCEDEKDDQYQDPEDLAEINKDLQEAKPSEGLEFKEGTDKETGNKYYSVTGIGECKDTVIVIPSEYNGLPVTRIATKAFSESDIAKHEDRKRIERVYIPESVTSIAHHAFSECEALTSIRLPDSLKTLDSNAFEGCTGVTALYLGQNIEKISKSAFEDCKNISVVYLPASLKEMGTQVFKGCSKLGKVVYECKDMTYIAESTFYDCTTLQEIVLPEALVEIRDDAFRGCESISEFEIPNTVTKVGNRAFFRCSALQRLFIPVSVETWGNFVTYFCKNLSEFIYEGTLEEWDQIKCYPPVEAGEAQRVVSPNESLSMYLSIIATEVKCANGSVDIKQVMKDNGFMDSDNLNVGDSSSDDDETPAE